VVGQVKGRVDDNGVSKGGNRDLVGSMSVVVFEER